MLLYNLGYSRFREYYIKYSQNTLWKRSYLFKERLLVIIFQERHTFANTLPFTDKDFHFQVVMLHFRWLLLNFALSPDFLDKIDIE